MPDDGWGDGDLPGGMSADSGMVTAEAALALPCLVLALLGALFLAGAGAVKVACTDAAGSAARALSRGDSLDRARAVALAAAPGATVSLQRSPAEVLVDVHRNLHVPRLFGGFTVVVGAHVAGVPEPAGPP